MVSFSFPLSISYSSYMWWSPITLSSSTVLRNISIPSADPTSAILTPFPCSIFSSPRLLILMFCFFLSYSFIIFCTRWFICFRRKEKPGFWIMEYLSWDTIHLWAITLVQGWAGAAKGSKTRSCLRPKLLTSNEPYVWLQLKSASASLATQVCVM